MIGKLISSAIRVVTLPVDAVSAAADIVTGGDGTKESRIQEPLTGDLERLRDAVAKAAEEIDES